MAGASTPVSTCNRLLAALPPAVLAHLLPKFTRVPLALRQSLYRPDQPIEAVYFFEAGMASLVAHLEDGVQAEVGVVGREGMLGLPLVHGVATSFNLKLYPNCRHGPAYSGFIFSSGG